MDIKLNPSRYAHCEGHTGVCFSQDAGYIITCGGEGDIRIWMGIEDDEATDKCVGEKAFAVCQRGDKLYVGTDQNSVQTLTFPEAELDGVVARFTAPVVAIDASSDGSIIASASCDMMIGLTDTAKQTTAQLAGHKAPVLSVALDPRLEYLVSSSCDGTVRVWSMKDHSEVTQWDCVPRSNSWHHATSLGCAAWLPGTGAQLAVPFHSEVRLFMRDSWAISAMLADPNPGDQMFSVVAASSCGRYLAASTTEGHVCVWSLSSLSLLACLRTEERQHVCSLAWSPQIPQIAFCDTSGNFGTIDLPISTTSEKSKRPEDVPIADPEFGDTDDEDNENAISLEKIKNESGFLADLNDDKPEADEEDGRVSRQSEPPTPVPRVELQPPFQPSSTPTSLQYRFMVWNDVGIVKQTNTEDENTIDVEFLDTNHHHSFRVNNLLGHSLAALSQEVLVLACEASEDNPSKLVCILLKAWDGSKEWTCQLPSGEDALCVAAGQGFVAVATDTRMLRVFTACGTQREVVSLPGPVVCLTAHQHLLTAVYHGATVGDGQSLWCQELWLGAGCVMRRCQALPLSPGAPLRWLGYSDQGCLCSLDTAGLMRQLTSANVWTPICDVDKQCKGKSDHHFVVGVNDTFQTIRSVLCKGAFYPPTFPRPTLSEISWQVPLCELEGEKGELEEQFWHCSLALPALDNPDHAERTIKKTLLKLFALACQTGLEMRAVGLCQLMSPEVVQLAVKYASKLGRQQLANRISEAAAQRPPSPPMLHQSVAVFRSTEPDADVGSPQTLSQDMFASAMDDHRSETENPILALKQRQPSLTAANSMSSKVRRSNPFKKSSDDQGQSDKGLESLATAKPTAVRPAARPVEEPTKGKPKKAEVVHNENKPKKNAFADWFASQRESLQEEFPDLGTSELTKVALRRFKEEKQRPSNQSVTKFFGTNQENKTQTECLSPSNSNLESKKRKASEDDVQSPEPKKTQTVASKLKRFSFVKP